MRISRYQYGLKTLLIVLSSAVALVSGTASADIYRYVDKHGRVTLTDKPPHTGYKRLVKTWKGWVEQKSFSKVAYKNFLKNQKKYSDTIAHYAKLYQLPKPLLDAIISAESAYDPNAISTAGAVGMMQLMPATAKRYGVSNRKNAHENINGGSRYFRDLLVMFDNDLKLALAAYNAGENAVIKYGHQIPPYKETQNYVRKVLQYYKKYLQTANS